LILSKKWKFLYYQVTDILFVFSVFRALADIAILESVVEFKQRFYPRGWARYDLAKPGTLRLVPEGHILEAVKNDYKAMRNMIYGDYYDFEKIQYVLAELEGEINAL
jgi:hypothetical protein